MIRCPNDKIHEGYCWTRVSLFLCHLHIMFAFDLRVIFFSLLIGGDRYCHGLHVAALLAHTGGVDPKCVSSTGGVDSKCVSSMLFFLTSVSTVGKNASSMHLSEKQRARESTGILLCFVLRHHPGGVFMEILTLSKTHSVSA